MISHDQPFNPAQLQQLLGGDGNAIKDVIHIACETLPRAATRLASTNMPAAEARSIAHQLKGASRTSGADELAAFAATLEEELRSGWTPKARTLAATLPGAARRFLAATTAYLHAERVR